MGCLDAVHGPTVSPTEQAGMYVCTRHKCLAPTGRVWWRARGILPVIMVVWEGVTTIQLALPTSPLPLPPLPSPSPSPHSWRTTSWI